MPSFWAEREELARRGFPPAPPHKLESLRGPGASNVVLRGFALAGCHPGANTSETVASLTPLLRAGVTTFVCLQHELPRAGGAGLAHARSTYSGTNVVTAKHYLADAQAIVDAGGFPQSGGPPLTFLHLPITDAAGATVPDDVIKPFVLDLLAHMKAGEMLYIQCGDGNGRTGTVAALLLGLVYGLSSSEALDLAQRSRNDRPGAAGMSPETHDQKMQVHRLLSDPALRAAAAAVTPRRSNSTATDAASRLDGVLRKVRAVLTKRGPMALIYLSRYGASLARDGMLDWAAFTRLAADADWYLTAEESDTLWGAAGGAPSHAGGVAAAALAHTLRGTMPARRAEAVHDAFRRLSAGTGFTTLERLAAAFHPETHPDVRATRRTAADVKAEFYDTFGIGGAGETSRRQVGVAEFEAYYAQISAAVDDDAYFELLVFGSWPAPDAFGGKTAGAPTTRATLAARVAAADGLTPAAAAAAAAAKPPESALTAALNAAYGSPAAVAAALGDSIVRTEHGYAFVDIGNPRFLVPALRALLTSKSEFTLALLATALRRVDSRHDGCVTMADFAAALRDVGAPLPDADVELAFRSLAATITGAPTTATALPALRLPIADIHDTLRKPLNDTRRKVVLSTFNGFDRSGSGAVPVAALVLAFNAESYPAVTAGKVKPHVVYKAFQDSFAEGFALVDRYGPAARAAGIGSPAQRAYNGLGDGLVRFPFFEEFHEALGVSVEDDAAFAVIVGHMWSGGAGRRGQRALLDPHAAARRADVFEDGFLSSMERLSMNHPFAAAPGSATAPGLATRSFAHRGDAVIGTAMVRPPAHAASPPRSGAPSPGSAAEVDPSRDRGRRHNPAADFAVKYASSPSLYTGGDGSGSGGSSSAMRGSPRYVGGAGAAPRAQLPVPPVGDADADDALATMREVLLRRGPKSIHLLVRALEDAAAGSAGGRNLWAPMPAATFVAVLRDASFGLSPRGTDALVAAVAARSRSEPRTLVPYMLLLLLRGELPPARADVVRQAYAHVVRRSGHNPPALDDVRLLYASAAHPDVTAMKRREDDVLREFLETFDGDTYTGGPRAGGVPLEGFMDYYANASLYEPDDMFFSRVLFDTWSLSREEVHSALDAAAGKPTSAAYYAPATVAAAAYSYGAGGGGGGAGGSSGAAGASPGGGHAAYARWQREGSLVLGERPVGGGGILPTGAPRPGTAGDTTPRKGYGLERLGYGPVR